MKIRLLAACFGLILSFASHSAEAAFCALRDPVETIEKLFPRSTSHRSVIKVVGEEQRRAVSERLPPNTLHFSELGQHTLYVVFRDRVPQGYLHVRSEESEWGLVEVAWAFSTDLRVIDFHLQRCRSRAKRAIEAPEFRQQLTGLSYLEMKQLLTADGRTLQPGKLSVSAAARPLAEVVIRCGLKTLVVTELAWKEELAHYSRLARAQKSFEGATDLEAVPDPRLSEYFDTVSDHFPGRVTAMELHGTELYSVLSPVGKIIGAVFRHPLTSKNPGNPVEWHIAPDKRVVAVHNAANWPDPSTAEALASHKNLTFDEGTSCANRPQLLTKQATLMAQLVFTQ